MAKRTYVKAPRGVFMPPKALNDLELRDGDVTSDFLTYNEIMLALIMAYDRVHRLHVADDPFTGLVIAASQIGDEIAHHDPNFDKDWFLKGVFG